MVSSLKRGFLLGKWGKGSSLLIVMIATEHLHLTSADCLSLRVNAHTLHLQLTGNCSLFSGQTYICVSRRHVISGIISPAGEATSARKALWLGQDPSCVSGAGMPLQIRREFCPRARF